ncbi:MAG: PD40 domain-containing protein [Bacteroidetes bacterium]|nr:PD40 domain-containing protein [Bacteroidota bacterium]
MRFRIFPPLFTVCCLLFAVHCFAQPAQKKPKATGDIKLAEENFKNGNFEGALDEYLVLIKKDAGNEKYNYRIGVCYLNTDIDKTKAISYFEKIQNSAVEPETKYLLGRAYQYAYKFDDAIKILNAYKKDGKGSSENLKDVEMQVQYCLNSKELMKFPVNVSFENLGKNINSEYPDYFPFVPSDESFIIFNSKRPESGAWQYPDGSWGSNIYFSKVKDGQYAKAKLLGRVINSVEGEEEAIGLSGSGDYLLIYHDDFQGSGDIYISKADKSRNFKEPILLDEQINSQRGQEIAASISADGNAIFFASTRPGGFGGSDIYVCRRLPTGGWGPAQNLGEEINTPFNEDFPNISPDGNMIFFSSMGHTSMGGYDIFVAKWDETNKKFSGAKNIGYPINSPEDDMNFRISSTGKFGYISARKKDGFGDMDIYRIDFLDVDPDYTVITGKVMSKDASKPVDSTHVFISVTDFSTGDEFGSYMPNPNSGRYVIILPPGKFIINTEIPGYDKYSETIQILDKSSFKPLIEKNIMLMPEGGIAVPPKKK